MLTHNTDHLNKLHCQAPTLVRDEGILFRPVTYVFGQKQAWHDNQPEDIVHVNGEVIGCTRRVNNGHIVGWGVFNNKGALVDFDYSYPPRTSLFMFEAAEV